MKYLSYAFTMLLFIFYACSFQPQQEVTSVSYRGWNQCIKISNKVVSVIVNPTYGGQIIYFGLNSREENILWTDSVVNGWQVDDYIRTRRSPDAGRFDIGNERKTEHIHDSVWAGPYQTFIESDGTVRLRSIPSQTMGIQVERRFSFEENQPVLYIDQRMTNISDTVVEYCFWTRTLLPAGGVYFCEAIPDSVYALGFSEISLAADTLIPSEGKVERISVDNHYFMAFPGGNKEKKYGIFTMNGTYSYQFKDYLYIKQNEYFPHETYENNHQVRFPNMIYFNDQFLEMEPNSPMIRLNPGESYEYREIWTLMDLTMRN